MGISKAYLDSVYLLTIVNEERDMKEVKRILYNLKKNNTFEVFMPQAALGEIFAVAWRDCTSIQTRLDMTEKIVKVIEDEGIRWESMTTAKHDAFNIMVKLSEKDNELDATDIMIVAHVLSDPDSKFLFTNDNKLLGNTAILDLEEELRAEGKRNTDLKIKDNI